MPITRQASISYPIGLLEVGDSFFLPVITPYAQLHILKRLAEERNIKIRYETGIDPTSGLYGMRVTRTA